MFAGEMQPYDVITNIETLRHNGYAGILFWSWNAHDGYGLKEKPEMDKIAEWIKNNQSKQNNQSNETNVFHASTPIVATSTRLYPKGFFIHTTHYYTSRLLAGKARFRFWRTARFLHGESSRRGDHKKWSSKSFH